MSEGSAIVRSVNCPNHTNPILLPRKAASQPGLDWKFVHANPNAGKDFGNAGVYATPQSIPSLVRETGQNSLDAASGTSIFYRITLFELSAASDRRKRFLETIRFGDRLEHHIAAAAKSGGSTKIGTKLASGLRSLQGSAPLRLLRIEDFGTRGLKGDEHDSTQPFSALVRDNLNSQKSQKTAGGVFGIGSKTLWACSRLSTVMFSTIVDGETARGCRLIGKADLAYHVEQEDQFSGAGWFGMPTGDDGASSVWPADESVLADSLLDRSPIASHGAEGTSALIVGFYDPKADDESGDEIVKRFNDAIAENFWPAMVKNQLAAEVVHYVDDESKPRNSVHVDPNKCVPEMTAAYRAHLSNDLVERLEKPGDTVSVPIQLTVPASRPGGGIEPAHSSVDAECRLVIRLADPLSAADSKLDHVAFARGRAMVVKYDRRGGLTTGARPFHAVLLAGTLAGSGAHEKIAEQFLRFSEPTAHDDWALNGDLKERYATGAGQRLRELNEAITKALREYVKAESSASSDGPAILKELFSLRVPKRLPPKAKLKLSNVRADVEGNGWRVSGDVAVDATEVPFKITPRAIYDAESGKGVELQWGSLSATQGTIDGQQILLPAGTRKLRFEGIAVVKGLPPVAARCVLRVDASLGFERGVE